LQSLQGLVYGGKTHVKDRRYYKPMYLDIYKVRTGDSLKTISNNFYNDSRRAYEIAVINGIKENAKLENVSLLKIIRDGVYIDKKAINPN